MTADSIYSTTDLVFIPINNTYAARKEENIW